MTVVIFYNRLKRRIVSLNRVPKTNDPKPCTFDELIVLPNMYRILFLLLLSYSIGASAQDIEKWSLQECIEFALTHNTSIQQNSLQGNILENNLKQVKLSRIPSLNASGNHNYNIGRFIDPFTNTFNTSTIQSNSFSVSSGVLLYGGSQVNNAIKQAKVASSANDKSTEVLRNQISLSIATTYLQILQAEESLRVSQEQLNLSKKQLEQAEKLIKSGSANQSVRLNLQAQMANDNVTIVNAQNSIQLAYNTLMNLMQWPMDKSFEIEKLPIDKLPVVSVESVAMLYETALSNLPEVQQAMLNIEQASYGQKIASGALQPSVTAYGNVNTLYSQSGRDAKLVGYEPVTVGVTKTTLEEVIGANPIIEYSDKAFGSQLSDNLGQQVGVSVSVPIFNGYRNRTALENAKLNSKIAELGLQTTKNQLRSDVTTAYTNLKGAKSRYDAAQSSEIAQKLNFEFSQKRFDAGVMNSVDLLTARNQWNQAQMQLLNAKYEFLFRSLIIDFYKGNQLKL